MFKKVPFVKNKKTGSAHTGLLPTFVGALSFLLIQFGVVPAKTLDAQTIGAIVTILGILSMGWSNWRTPR